MPSKHATPVRYTPAMSLRLARCPYSDGYEFEAKACFVDTSGRKDDCHLGELTGFGFSFGAPENWRQLENFRFHVWVNSDATAYGSGPSWEPGSYVKFEEIARMAKASTRIERALDRITKERGYTADTAEWFGRVAEVIGCNLFLEPHDRDRPSRTGYRYRTYESVGEAVNHVRWMLSELKRKNSESHAPA